MWLLVSRGGGDSPSSSANRLAGNWFYQLFTLSTTIPAALGKNIVFHFKWVWKNHLKNRAVQSLCWRKASEGNEASHWTGSIYKCGMISSIRQDKTAPKASLTCLYVALNQLACLNWNPHGLPSNLTQKQKFLLRSSPKLDRQGLWSGSEVL